jgi:uncharacterized protein
MPETIRSLLFWLFMFLRMGSVETKPGRSPVLSKKALNSPSIVVPSLREVLQPFSAVIVTGGSSGIGKSLIRLCSTLKPDLCFCNISRRSPAENIFSNPEKSLNHFSCDLGRAAEVARAAADVTEAVTRQAEKGRILLLNNSGFGSFGAFPEQNLSRELEMLDVNIRGLVHLTGLMLPLLQARGGVVMTIASTLAFQPAPFAATYAATKAFVLHWTLALNEELRGSRVRAIAVCPGTTDTGFFRTAGVDQPVTQSRFTLTPDEVARAALQAVANGRGLVVPGLGNKLYTSVSARLPKIVAAKLAGSVMRRRRTRGSSN